MPDKVDTDRIQAEIPLPEDKQWSAQDHRWEYELQGCVERSNLEASADGPPDWKSLSVTAIAAENSSVGEYIASLEQQLAEAQRTIAEKNYEIGQLKPCLDNYGAQVASQWAYVAELQSENAALHSQGARMAAKIEELEAQALRARHDALEEIAKFADEEASQSLRGRRACELIAERARLLAEEGALSGPEGKQSGGAE